MKYTCPCCGYKVLNKPEGSFEICPICYWEADRVQSTNPDEETGPNPVSLKQAKKNFALFGASVRDHIKRVRKPTDKDKKG